MKMKNEQEIVTAYFKVLSWNSPGQLKKPWKTSGLTQPDHNLKSRTSRTPRTLLLDGSVEDYKGMWKDEENNMKRNLGVELLMENMEKEEK